MLFGRLRPKRQHSVYAFLLIAAALNYVRFSLWSEDPDWIQIETGGVALFSIIAVLGLKVSPWILVVGWVAHVVWDVGLHSYEATPFVPGWYAMACVTYDFIIAGYIAIQCKGWNAMFSPLQFEEARCRKSLTQPPPYAKD